MSKAWSEEKKAAFSADWISGVSSLQIRKRYSIGNSQMQRYVDRLGLQHRPSPIQRGGEPKATCKPLPAGATTLPPLPSLETD